MLDFCACPAHLGETRKAIATLSYNIRRFPRRVDSLTRTRRVLVAALREPRGVPYKPPKPLPPAIKPIQFVRPARSTTPPKVDKPAPPPPLPLTVAHGGREYAFTALDSELESFAMWTYREACAEAFSPDARSGLVPMDPETYMEVCGDPIVREIATCWGTGSVWQLVTPYVLGEMLAGRRNHSRTTVGAFYPPDNHGLAHPVHEVLRVARGGGFVASGLGVRETVLDVGGRPCIVELSKRK